MDESLSDGQSDKNSSETPPLPERDPPRSFITYFFEFFFTKSFKKKSENEYVRIPLPLSLPLSFPPSLPTSLSHTHTLSLSASLFQKKVLLFFLLSFIRRRSIVKNKKI